MNTELTYVIPRGSEPSPAPILHALSLLASRANREAISHYERGAPILLPENDELAANELLASMSMRRIEAGVFADADIERAVNWIIELADREPNQGIAALAMLRMTRWQTALALRLVEDLHGPIESQEE